jgi:chemotaxis protein MotA
MDISTIVGIVIAFGSLALGYTLEKGIVTSLFLASPLITVFGGTMGAIIMSYGMNGVLGALKSLFKSYSPKNAPQPDAVIAKICDLSNICRKEGLLSLQTKLNDPDLNTDRFLLLKEGMILTLDLKSAEEIQTALETDIRSYDLQKKMEIDVFEGAGGFSPTLGVIGTVMGLVQVLSSMSDVASLTSSIAVAFIATLYGVVFANLIYLPAANRLKTALKRELFFKEMIITGICMIASGKGSRDIQNRLSLYYHAFENGDKKYIEGINN